MSVSKLFTCRRSSMRSRKPLAILLALAFVASSIIQPPTVRAQAQVAPVSAGFNIDAGDLRFIFHAIEIAQAHAAGGNLVGPGPNQVSLFGNSDPQLPLGLRTVDGSFNNLVPGQTHFGAADLLFPRLLTPSFKPAEAGTSYAQTAPGNIVTDSQPRLISNLIVDQSSQNPAAVAAWINPCGSGGFVCGGGGTVDPTTGALFIPNITPDFGLSAPFNLLFAFFGQFFDHGLDLVTKGGGTVIVPLKTDDPLIAGPDHLFGTADDIPVAQRFMAVTRGTNMGTGANLQNGQNTTTPWVDQNQTYTSHPSHQVFLREYVLTAGRPIPTGKVADGGFCAPRPTGIPGDSICNIANWNEVKAQASTRLGIRLLDQDVFDVPMLLTDPYGHFKPGTNGFPQIMLTGGGLLQGNPLANAGAGVAIPANALRTGHAFLNDIAHAAAPNPGLLPDLDTVAGTSLAQPPAGRYDDELLGLHMVTGDGRGNENIGLSMMHQIFHSEHNRLVADIDRLINTPGFLTAAEVTAWKALNVPSGWGYGERLFQAARFCTEMQYQHLVFEEFARKIQPLINPFLGGITSINPAISAEFAHVVYRLGHSMLPEVLTRINSDDVTGNDIRLFDGFLNPASFNDGGPCAPASATCVNGRLVLNAAQAAGSLVRGLSRTVANELDEFVTSSVRNTLVGLPLDLPAINIARGRSEGIPALNVARQQFFAATHDAAVEPYTNWFEFGLNLKHQESLTNFVAAYGTATNIVNATALPVGCLPQNCTTSLIEAKRAAAAVHVQANDAFMFSPASTSGLDNVDFWVGGLAERQAVFGGLLGSTFNFVFEKQLENLQDGDRFYYLQRTDGLNLRFQLEGNSLAELIRRNTDTAGGMDIIFNTADVIISFSQITGNTFDSGDGTIVVTLPDGTKMFLDPLHRGKNIVFNGGAGVDKFRADVGDDTLYGNDGADRLDGWEGNDTLHGGNGDDILFGGNGDDVIKGGNGHDAMNSGPGFGGDLLIGGEGNDFLLGGNDGVEHFGGGGNDIIIDGTTRTEGAFGGTGDDWIDGGDGHDGGLFGDNGNVFDLTAGVDPVGGDDVIDGGPGQDGHFGEGGDDIFLQSEGSNKFFGDFGFDWITQRAWPLAGDIELSLLALPNAPVNFNDLRNKYRFVDGASGWNLNDTIRGSNSVLCDPAAGAIAECLVIGMELTAAGAAKITGLTQVMGPTGFNQSLTAAAIPGIKGVGFMGGDILLGGGGNDILEGKAGDDLIDGDRWLNVQLQAKMNNGSVKRVNNASELIDDVFSDPQRLNPGNITIRKEILFTNASAANVDTAVFAGPQSNYSFTVSGVAGHRILTVVDNVGTPGVGGGIILDGTDKLRGIERLQFADGTVNASTIDPLFVTPATTTVPNNTGALDTAAIASLTDANLGVSLAFATSTAANEGRVLTQTPSTGTVATGTTVALVIGSGPAVAVNVLVPNVVGLLLGTPATPGPARTGITGAALVVGAVTSVASLEALDTVISTSPVSSTSVASGSAVNVTRSSGVAPVNVLVPDVVGQVQATAQANIAAAGLTSSIVTAVSATVAAGSVISTSPVAGTSVATGSNVVLTVSLGPAPVLVPNVVGQAQATAQANIVAAGLTSSIVTANSAAVPAGNVISTSPVVGTSVATGSNVVLTISLGPAAPVTVPVPNVVGQAQATAQANIAAAGLTSSIVTANSATVAAGNVISTSPVATTIVLVGSNVVLTVSLGPVAPVTVPVPNVVGQVQATAQANITAAGLTSSVVTANSATVAAGLVISTSPVAATSVAVGSNVVLTVSLGPAAVGLPAPFVTQDVGAVGVAGSATAVGGLFSVTGSGADIFDAVDAFRYVYQPLAADGQIVARVVTQQNTDPWAKAGVMIRENLTAGSRNAMVAVTPGNGVEFQRRTATGGLSTFTPDGGAAAPTWVKLVRTGSTITAFSSPNGVTYTLIGTDTIAVAGSVFIGLAVSSHNNAVTNLSTFDNVTVSAVAPPPPPPPPGPLAPWIATDIGTVGVAGSTTLAGGLFTVNGSGNDIWDAADAFHYVYQPLAADGTITARVVTQQNTDPWAKSGVMIRESLTAGSRNAMVAVTPSNGVEFQRRTATSGASTFTAGPATSAPIWVRLVRTGTTITASSSADGVTFTPIGTDTIPAGSVFVGLAVSSHNNAVVNVSTFDNVVKVP